MIQISGERSLIVDAVCKEYGQDSQPAKSVLKDVSLTIPAGGFVSLLGPSGCGKTTLLNIIAGFIPATSGAVTLNGERVAGPGIDRGVVFQHGALFEWLTVFGNAAFGLKMSGTPAEAQREKILAYLEMAGLKDFIDYPIYALSGGMRQRLALVRSLIPDPSALLMDEPLGALDALTREKMRMLLLDLWEKTGKMFFLITHDVDEALFLSTDLYVMSSLPGRIIRHIESPFSDLFHRAGIREVRRMPEFLSLREEILDLIWDYA